MRYASSLAVATALIFAGCGGSDGGSISNPPVTAPPPDLALSSGNGMQVMQVAYLTASGAGDMAGLVTNTGISAEPGGVAKVPLPGQLAKPLANAISNVPIGPETLPCDVSGSITVSGDIANPLTLSAGDTINMDADNCDDGLGEIADGLIASLIQVFSGDLASGLFNMTIRMDITNYQVTTANDVLLSHGDVTVMLDNTTQGYVSASVSANAMTTSSNTGTETLYSFLSAQTIDTRVSPSPYTMSTSGTVDSSELGGIVELSTPVMFEGLDNDYPSTGELLVTGAGGSTVRLITVDNVDIIIEIDSDGMDPVDQTINTTWVEFTS
jgi:hypothetical protein